MIQHRQQSTSSNGASAGKKSELFPFAHSSPFLEKALSSLAMCESDITKANSLINFNTQDSKFLFEVLHFVTLIDKGLRPLRLKESFFNDCLAIWAEGNYKLAAMALKDPERAEGFYLALNPSYFFCDGKTVDQNKWFAIDLSILWTVLEKDGRDESGILTPEATASVSDLGRYVSALRRRITFRSALERFVTANSGQAFPRSLNVGTFGLRTDFRNPAKADAKLLSQIKDVESKWELVNSLPLSALPCYPSIISGPSGSGKSVAAHQLTKFFASRLTDKFFVFSVCIVPSDLKEGGRALDSKGSGGLFSAIANAVVTSITERLRVFGDYSRCLDGVFLHCILDEMGSHPEWVHALVCDSATAAAEINRRLRSAGFEGSLSAHFTIVGAGVDGLPDSIGSIGLPYWRPYN